MHFKLTSAPYTHSTNTVASVMRHVLYALLPGIVVYIWFFGWGIFINIILASITALISEALMLWLRQRPLKPFLMDNSAIVMAWLLALALPPLMPWWITVLGTAFGIIVGKHIYGGLGYNLFNPAMVGYVLLLISFPLEMTHWETALNHHPIGLIDSLSMIVTGHPTSGLTLDAVSSATPLDSLKIALGQFRTITEIKTNPLFGYFGGQGWEWVNGAFLLGGIWLLYKRVITWHIPVATLGALFMFASLLFLIDSDDHASPLFHLFSGASILGAFFIATDPVTAATSNQGRLIYGAGIGCLTYVIRVWGGYPDGLAFAVLLMNMAVPTIDYYTQPRLFGQ